MSCALFATGRVRAAECKSGTGGEMSRTGLEQAVTPKRRTANKKRKRDWVEQLKIAVDKQLKTDCDLVAQSLAEQARVGNLSCMRFLVSLRNVEREKKPQPKSSGFSQADAWFTEPEWQGEMCEASVDERMGGVEPEG